MKPSYLATVPLLALALVGSSRVATDDKTRCADQGSNSRHPNARVSTAFGALSITVAYSSPVGTL